jgi:hypothetical protein
MVVTNEPLDEVCESCYGDTITIPTNSVINTAYMSTITNMATVQNFEAVSDKFNADRICTPHQNTTILKGYFWVETLGSVRIQRLDFERQKKHTSTRNPFYLVTETNYEHHDPKVC